MDFQSFISFISWSESRTQNSNWPQTCFLILGKLLNSCCLLFCKTKIIWHFSLCLGSVVNYVAPQILTVITTREGKSDRVRSKETQALCVIFKETTFLCYFYRESHNHIYNIPAVLFFSSNHFLVFLISILISYKQRCLLIHSLFFLNQFSFTGGSRQWVEIYERRKYKSPKDIPK